MKAFRQMARGCTDLPHVGEHPGTMMLLCFVVLGALAGRDGGLPGVLGGAAIMAIGIGPFYLWGAYDRANLSDRLEAEDGAAPAHPGEGEKEGK